MRHCSDVEQSDKSSYPGGKSGAGIYQRLINLIPPHRVLIVPFAGHCGIVRNIRPAEHTIVIDQDPLVCEWWASWRRSKHGRDLEIHNCDGIEWLRYRLGFTEYSASAASVAAGRVAGSNDSRSSVAPVGPATDERGATRLIGPRPRGTASVDRRQIKRLAIANSAALASDAQTSDARATEENASEYFAFLDPPYVLSERTGKLYNFELEDSDHLRLLGILTADPASRYQIMLCGYDCELYSELNSLPGWKSIDHRVPTRGGLQDERIWMNYQRPTVLHDYQYIGDSRRSRERIRRRQRNWLAQLNAMPGLERRAMLEALGVEQ